jgi:hypothetical protein
MRDLHEMTIGQRIVLTAAIVIIVLLLLAVFGYLTGRWDEAGGAPLPVPPLVRSKYDERLLALDREGIEAAYRAQVTLLFQNWMKDPDVGQPHRALTGLRNAARAYITSMDGAARREEEIRNNPRQ